MRIVALPSIYDKQYAAQPPANLRPVWAIMAAGVGVAVLGAVFVRSQALSFLTLAGSWAIVFGVYAFSRASRSVGQGEAGEHKALAALSLLPDEYVAITNYRVPGYERIGDIDIIVVGPPGVVVIEVKNYQSHVVVDGDNWSALSRGGPRPMRSVSKQIRDETRALGKYLTGRHLSTPVHGIIGINPTALIEIVRAPSFPIVAYDSLAANILDMPPAGDAMIDVIERKLCSNATTT